MHETIPGITVADLDLRAEPREPCPDQPWMRLAAAGEFRDALVRMRDISTRGIGFFTALPLEPGTRVALLWHFGPQWQHRTLTARVVHAAAVNDRITRVGCAFDEPLPPEALSAFLRAGGRPPQ